MTTIAIPSVEDRLRRVRLGLAMLQASLGLDMDEIFEDEQEQLREAGFEQVRAMREEIEAIRSALDAPTLNRHAPDPTGDGEGA